MAKKENAVNTDSIYDVLTKIQSELQVSKDRHNNFGNFDYYNVQDIFVALKPLLKKYNASLCFEDSDILLVGSRYYFVETATLRYGDESIRAKGITRESETPKAKMDEGQLSGGTSSYAQKYALNKMFLISDGIDLDSDMNTDSRVTSDINSQESERSEAIRRALLKKISSKVSDSSLLDRWAAIPSEKAIEEMTEYHTNIVSTVKERK